MVLGGHGDPPVRVGSAWELGDLRHKLARGRDGFVADHVGLRGGYAKTETLISPRRSRFAKDLREGTFDDWEGTFDDCAKDLREGTFWALTIGGEDYPTGSKSWQARSTLSSSAVWTALGTALAPAQTSAANPLAPACKVVNS